jgi:hypothetical protein
MQKIIRNIVSFSMLAVFVWMATATSKDAEIFTLKANIEFANDAIIVTNNDSFIFTEYSLTLILPGGANDSNANYTYYTIDFPIAIGSNMSIPLDSIRNVGSKPYPRLVVPESAALNAWSDGKIGILDKKF